MKILVTGASGFIGRHVMAEAVARGHETVGLARSPSGGAASITHDLTTAPPDLNGRHIDAVIHLAAGMAGTAAALERVAVQGTRHLLTAMAAAKINRLVGVSSLAILDYRGCPPGSLIDERVATAPLKELGGYAAAKLAQEALYAGFATQPGACGVILRPGLVYDETRLSAAHAGFLRGKLCVSSAHDGEIPVIHVRSLARAMIDAVELGELGGGECIHLVDDNLPRHDAYLDALRRRGELPPRNFSLPWRVLAALTAIAGAAASGVGAGERLPEAFRPQGFAARCKPFRYSNDKAKSRLGWQPDQAFV
jgi:nucleoside-diphosphate-sugar epimerase